MVVVRPRRRTRVLITGGVLAARVAPVVADTDGAFPLSTYPMYSRARGTETTLVTADGVTAAGSEVTLTPTLIGNSDDPLIVVGELRAALRADRADERCADIAERVAARADRDAVVAIEVVSERHDNVERTLGEASRLQRDVEARCEVVR